MIIEIINKNNIGQYIQFKTSDYDIKCVIDNNLKIFSYRDINKMIEYTSFIRNMKNVFAVYKGVLNCETKADYALALLINNYFSKVYDNSFMESYDLTFCYAFPLYEQTTIKSKIIKNLDIINKVKFLVYQNTNEYMLYKVIGKDKELHNLLFHYRNIMKKCNCINVKKSYKIENIFNNWKDFYMNRFGKKYTEDEVNAFLCILNEEDYYINDYYVDDYIVCSNLIYHDNVHKIIYDILAPWDLSYKKMSLGIYSILFTVKQAVNFKCDYSLCYGNLEYKNELFKHFC